MSVSVSCMRESALEQKVGADSFGLSVLGVFGFFLFFPMPWLIKLVGDHKLG